MLQFQVNFTVLDQDNATLGNVEINLGNNITLLTGSDGLNISNFLDVNQTFSLTISKLGYEVVDAPNNITINQYAQSNAYTFKMAIKKVNFEL